MTHDPLCPAPKDWWRTCACDILAQARADAVERYLEERRRVVLAEMDYKPSNRPAR